MDDEDEDVILNSVLSCVAEKALVPRCKPETVVYCPTMDLVALVAEDQQLHVFRLNGQRVFSTSFKNGKDENQNIHFLSWKPNGQLLAAACEDNIARLVNSSNGKTVHQLAIGSTSPKIRANYSLGWGINLTDTKSTREALHTSINSDLSLDDLLLSTTLTSHVSQLKADLPRELALLDIESALPKLSTLPSTGGDDDVFSSRASIDAIFHPPLKSPIDTVDVLLLGLDDARMHLRVFDSFEIGTISLRSSLKAADEYRFLAYASHPLASTHTVLVETRSDSTEYARTKTDRGPQLTVLSLDLRFITSSGRYLSLLASKSTQLQNLLRYVQQVQAQIDIEWRTGQDLPSKYMRNINEALEEKCNCNFLTAAYHLLVTGNCYDPLKEFLVDEVGERGHKRWEKAVATSYENIRRLTHECLIPALERCSVILSRLNGLSRFSLSSHTLGLQKQSLNRIADSIDCLGLLAHKILLYTGLELRQFTAFARWLRHEIDVQAADASSSSIDELVEQSDTVDYHLVLTYIQGAMTRSALLNYIDPSVVKTSHIRHVEENEVLFEVYKDLLRADGPVDRLPRMSDLTARLTVQSNKMFGEVAETLRKNILHRSALSLPEGLYTTEKLDVRMRVGDDGTIDVYLVTAQSSNTDTMRIYRIRLRSVNGVTSTDSVVFASLSLDEGEVRDVKFVDDDELMILCSYETRASASLFSLRCLEGNWTGFDPAMPYASDDASDRSKYLTLRHTFEDPKRKPGRIEINGRKGRRAICVVDEDGQYYSVFDLDNAPAHSEDSLVQDGDEEMVDT